jgi:hypothetical protein
MFPFLCDLCGHDLLQAPAGEDRDIVARRNFIAASELAKQNLFATRFCD